MTPLQKLTRLAAVVRAMEELDRQPAAHRGDLQPLQAECRAILNSVGQPPELDTANPETWAQEFVAVYGPHVVVEQVEPWFAMVGAMAFTAGRMQQATQPDHRVEVLEKALRSLLGAVGPNRVRIGDRIGTVGEVVNDALLKAGLQK